MFSLRIVCVPCQGMVIYYVTDGGKNSMCSRFSVVLADERSRGCGIQLFQQACPLGPSQPGAVAITHGSRTSL
jgi:hypothetical protein